MRVGGGCKIRKYLDRYKQEHGEHRMCPVYVDLNEKERLYCERKNCEYRFWGD